MTRGSSLHTRHGFLLHKMTLLQATVLPIHFPAFPSKHVLSPPHLLLLLQFLLLFVHALEMASPAKIANQKKEKSIFSEEELQVAEILFQLQQTSNHSRSLPFLFWGTKKKRSSIIFSISAFFNGEKSNAAKVDAPSPATPLSFSPSESESKPKQLRTARRRALKKKKKVEIRFVSSFSSMFFLFCLCLSLPSTFPLILGVWFFVSEQWAAERSRRWINFTTGTVKTCEILFFFVFFYVEVYSICISIIIYHIGLLNGVKNGDPPLIMMSNFDLMLWIIGWISWPSILDHPWLVVKSVRPIQQICVIICDPFLSAPPQIVALSQ